MRGHVSLLRLHRLGAMLSHRSIVAREYGSPCIVSVSGCPDLDDGAGVQVDGFSGVVTVESSTPPPEH